MNHSANPYSFHHNDDLSHHWPVTRRAAIYSLAGLVTGMALLANLDMVGGMLEEVIPVFLEVVEKGLDSFFETVGLAPRLAQGITAYIGLTVGLILGYRLVLKVRFLIHQTRHRLADFTAESRDWISATVSAARTGWTNLPWRKKLLVSVIGTVVFVPLAMALSTVLGLAVAELL